MSAFTTQTGLLVTCEDPTCSCNDGPTYSKPATRGGLLAQDEERWFNHVCNAVEEYLHILDQRQLAGKAAWDSFDERVHEAKRAVIDQFYAMGWDRA
jgi:hypothetical protein